MPSAACNCLTIAVTAQPPMSLTTSKTLIDLHTKTFQLPSYVAIFLQTIGDVILLKKAFDYFNVFKMLLLWS